ncbi:MAG: aminotransferase [Alphaproteobacteria bacterium]|nr:aminotransferase [Alphaproteobacteria bacterium]MDP6563463.1 aminotransferase [Alphaproteobacteria bacterium]
MSVSDVQQSNRRDPTLLLGFTNLPDNREREPLRIVRGQGIFIYDDKGKDYIEGVSSFYCTSLGFSEESLIEAAVRQMRELPFYVSAAHRTVPVVEQLAERLAALVPMPNAKVAFAATGSEANDALVKFLWFHNNAVGQEKRKKVIARLGSYHGGTIATASLTGWVKYHAGFDLPMAGFLHTQQPDYYHLGEPGESEEAFADRMVADLRDLIVREDPETIGAFLAEPVSMSAGLAVPPRSYWDKLTALLDEYEIRLFDDEVITGFGRTGNMLGCETYRMTPDCITVAKALSSAYQPISAVIMSEGFYEGLERGSDEAGMFSHAGTYHGHPVPAAVALRVLELMEERDILGHVRAVSGHFQAALDALKEHPLVADCRSIGLAGAVELALDKTSGGRAEPAGALGGEFATRCQDNGLFIRPVADAAVLAPPLIITAAEIDETFRRFRLALDETLDWSRREWPAS